MSDTLERTAVVTREPSDASSLMEVISRAAADPGVDVSKLERLLGMYERVQASQAKSSYYAALSEMQDLLPVIQERGEIKIREDKPGQKYALWEDINKAIKPILKAHGFALSFRIGQEDKQITVTGVLSHKDGHSEATTIYLPSDTSGSKNAVQAVGSSASYGKRYTASALLNLTSSGDDDDGKSAGSSGAITEEQAATILGLLTRDNADVGLFCKFMKVPSVLDISASEYKNAIRVINETAINRAAAAKKTAAPK